MNREMNGRIPHAPLPQPPHTPQAGWSGRTIRLALACLVALVATLVAITDAAHPLLRLLFALPLVVVIPGYALMAATCPSATISGAERLALSIGTSLTLAVLGGLLLNWAPWGLRPESWAGLLSALTIVAAVVAVARGRWNASGSTVVVDRAPARAGLGLGAAFMLAAAIAITCGTVYFARVSAAMGSQDGFTQVWMLPAPTADALAVRLGVKCLEAAGTTYALRLDVDGVPVQTWTSIELAPGQTWEATAELPADMPAGVVAEVRLYRVDGQPPSDDVLSDPAAAYRRVVLRR